MANFPSIRMCSGVSPQYECGSVDYQPWDIHAVLQSRVVVSAQAGVPALHMLFGVLLHGGRSCPPSWFCEAYAAVTER